MTTHSGAWAVMDYVGPALGAGLFVVLMSRVPAPTRRTLNAMIVAGASGVYISGGGFGVWELACPLVVMPMAYRGLISYRAIGVAWLVHSAWDLPHHLWGNPIWPFMPASSLGCFIFDALIAMWFFALSRDPSRERASTEIEAELVPGTRSSTLYR